MEGKEETNWRVMSDEIMTGVMEWREQHPKATFREIEEEVDRRLSELRVRMLSDVAIRSASTEWNDDEKAGLCPQ